MSDLPDLEKKVEKLSDKVGTLTRELASQKTWARALGVAIATVATTAVIKSEEFEKTDWTSLSKQAEHSEVLSDMLLEQVTDKLIGTTSGLTVSAGFRADAKPEVRDVIEQIDRIRGFVESRPQYQPLADLAVGLHAEIDDNNDDAAVEHFRAMMNRRAAGRRLQIVGNTLVAIVLLRDPTRKHGIEPSSEVKYHLTAAENLQMDESKYFRYVPLNTALAAYYLEMADVETRKGNFDEALKYQAKARVNLEIVMRVDVSPATIYKGTNNLLYADCQAINWFVSGKVKKWDQLEVATGYKDATALERSFEERFKTAIRYRPTNSFNIYDTKAECYAQLGALHFSEKDRTNGEAALNTAREALMFTISHGLDHTEQEVIDDVTSDLLLKPLNPEQFKDKIKAAYEKHEDTSPEEGE